MSRREEGGIVADGAARWLEGEELAVDVELHELDERLASETDADERARLMNERAALEESRRERLGKVLREAKDSLF